MSAIQLIRKLKSEIPQLTNDFSQSAIDGILNIQGTTCNIKSTLMHNLKVGNECVLSDFDIVGVLNNRFDNSFINKRHTVTNVISDREFEFEFELGFINSTIGSGRIHTNTQIYNIATLKEAISIFRKNEQKPLMGVYSSGLSVENNNGQSGHSILSSNLHTDYKLDLVAEYDIVILRPKDKMVNGETSHHDMRMLLQILNGYEPELEFPHSNSFGVAFTGYEPIDANDATLGMIYSFQHTMRINRYSSALSGATLNATINTIDVKKK